MDSSRDAILVSQKTSITGLQHSGKGQRYYRMEDQVTLGLVGDWGTGTDEAQMVADCVQRFGPASGIEFLPCN